VSCPREIPVHREEVYHRIHDLEHVERPVQLPEEWDELMEVN
jgi:sRNA-binding carbon storage regulator CsrA